MSDSGEASIDQTQIERLSKLGAEIEESIDWYETQAWRMQLLYVALIAIGTVSGFLATTLLNFDWPELKAVWPHRLISALPAFGSLATLVLATFGIRDLWQMREVGLYDARKIAIELERLSSDKGPKFEAACLAIKEKLRQLDRRQALRVIGALGGGALDPEG